MSISRHVSAAVAALILVLVAKAVCEWLGAGDEWLVGAVMYFFYRDFLRGDV